MHRQVLCIPIAEASHTLQSSSLQPLSGSENSENSGGQGPYVRQPRDEGRALVCIGIEKTLESEVAYTAVCIMQYTCSIEHVGWMRFSPKHLLVAVCSPRLPSEREGQNHGW